MRRQTILAIITSVLMVTGLAAQVPAPTARGGSAPKGLIVGGVVDAVSNVPVPSVIVTLAGASLGSSIRVLTDAQGRFLYRNVPSSSSSGRVDHSTGVCSTRRVSHWSMWWWPRQD